MTQTTLIQQEEYYISHVCNYKHCDMKGTKQVYSKKERKCPFCNKKTLKLVVK